MWNVTTPLIKSLPYSRMSVLLKPLINLNSMFPKMQLFFDPDEVVFDHELTSNSINLESLKYNHDYSTCMLTYGYCHKHTASISVIDVIWLDLCFIEPLIIPILDKDYPKPTVFNSFEQTKLENP